MAEIFEKVSFDHYNFRITRLSARKSEQMKNQFRGSKYAYIYRLNTKIRLTMLCLIGFDLYSRRVPLDHGQRLCAKVAHTTGIVCTKWTQS